MLKESTYTAAFLSINSKCVSLIVCHLVIETYHIRSIFYSRKVVFQKNTIKPRFVIEILSNLDIA